MIKFLFKVILFPIKVVLWIITAFLSFLNCIGTLMLSLVMVALLGLSIFCFMSADIILGSLALFLAFLVSPYGLPAVSSTLIQFIKIINKHL